MNIAEPADARFRRTAFIFMSHRNKDNSLENRKQRVDFLLQCRRILSNRFGKERHQDNEGNLFERKVKWGRQVKSDAIEGRRSLPNQVANSELDSVVSRERC